MDINGFQPIDPVLSGMGAENPKLKAAAHEFEASLMKEFLKPLEHDSLFSDNQAESDDDEGSAGAVMSFGSQAMATAISERGGFGIATMVLNHFRTHFAAAHPTDSPNRRLLPTTAAPPSIKVPNAVADERT